MPLWALWVCYCHFPYHSSTGPEFPKISVETAGRTWSAEEIAGELLLGELLRRLPSPRGAEKRQSPPQFPRHHSPAVTFLSRGIKMSLLAHWVGFQSGGLEFVKICEKFAENLKKTIIFGQTFDKFKSPDWGPKGVSGRTLENPFKTPSRTIRKPFKKVSKSIMR